MRWIEPAIALFLLFSVTAHANDIIPQQLVGTWGTAASLFEGADRQTEIYLDADGLGMIAGSTSAPARADGKSDDKPAPRGIAGAPIRATFDGKTLTAHPFIPGDAVQSRKAASLAIICLYAAAGPTLSCVAQPDQVSFLLKWRGPDLPADTIQMLNLIRGDHTRR